MLVPSEDSFKIGVSGTADRPRESQHAGLHQVLGRTATGLVIELWTASNPFSARVGLALAVSGEVSHALPSW